MDVVGTEGTRPAGRGGAGWPPIYPPMLVTAGDLRWIDDVDALARGARGSLELARLRGRLRVV